MLRACVIFFVVCASLLLMSDTHAVEAKPTDPDLPQPLDLNVTQPLLESSPFTRALNLSESLALTGIAYVKGKPVATIMDKITKQRFLVSEEPNAQGWRLAEANANSELKLANVKLIVGTEVVSIRYSDAQIAPEKKGSGGGGSYGPSRVPTEQEIMGKDEKGAYIRGMPYLSDDDRAKFRDVPREVREKFLEVVHDHRDTLFKASHEERATFVKKVFDSVMRK